MTRFEGEFAEGEILYVTREERIATDTAASTTNYGGIGAFVDFEAEETPHVVILDVIPGSPAEKAGLRAHDSVYAVDGSPVLLEEGSDVVLRIRGEAGTKVTLTVQTPGKDQREVEITRATISGIVGLNAGEISDTGIGYIRMPTVGSEGLAEEVVQALEGFQKNGSFKGLIIDLRISGANSNFPLEQMLALFLDNTIINIFDRTQSETYLVEGQDFSGSQEMPIVVLVGEHTSGPAEIFAAAVQESGRGIVMGSNTVGSIEAFSGFPLSNGAQIFIAIASYRIGGSEELGISGLSPEVRVEARWDEIDPANDPVIQEAIDSLEAQAEEVQE
jgi:carboxyl-terminal processing protease